MHDDQSEPVPQGRPQAERPAGLAAMAGLGGTAAFAACGLSLALLGLGLSFLAASAIAGLCAGLLIYALGRWAPMLQIFGLQIFGQARARRIPQSPAADLSAVRHELRGALSPAMMVTDRLLRNDDPAVRRAGEAVVRSVERAVALIEQPAPSIPTQAAPEAPETPDPDAPGPAG